MKLTTLIYLFNPQWQILLCAKKKTWWKFTAALGKRNGAWGKVHEWETFLQSVVRELREETWIDLPEEAFEHRGINTFYYENKPERDQECHVFVTSNFTWDAKESEELIPQRFNVDKLPYKRMRINDAIWLPPMLAGEYVEHVFYFNEDGSTILSYERIK